MQLKVTGILAETAAIRSLTLERADGNELPAFAPGSSIALQLTVDGEPIERHYSLIGDPADRKRYRIAVLLEEKGNGGSRHLHQQVQVGTELQVSAPRAGMALDRSAVHTILIAGGIGITPILSLARELHRVDASFEVHYAGRTREGLAFLTEVEALGPHVHIYTTDRGERMDIRRVLVSSVPSAVLYVCGPGRLMHAVRTAATELGWPAHRVHYENFGPWWSGSDHPLTVELAQTGITLDVPVGQTLLQAVEAAGMWVPADCRRGECAMCITSFTAGDVLHRDICMQPAERIGSLCLCVSWAASNRLVLDL